MRAGVFTLTLVAGALAITASAQTNTNGNYLANVTFQ